jgi:hypothetical protein
VSLLSPGSLALVVRPARLLRCCDWLADSSAATVSRAQGKFDAELIATANKIATPGKGILVGARAQEAGSLVLCSALLD